MLLLEHPQSKSKGYGQHGELQRAEIVKWVLTGCMRVAASHFSCFEPRFGDFSTLYQSQGRKQRESKAI